LDVVVGGNWLVGLGLGEFRFGRGKKMKTGHQGGCGGGSGST